MNILNVNKIVPTISSPGLHMSTKSSSNMASLDRGNLPAGTFPGLSCIAIL
jgi:hypothetical protein